MTILIVRDEQDGGDEENGERYTDTQSNDELRGHYKNEVGVVCFVFTFLGTCDADTDEPPEYHPRYRHRDAQRTRRRNDDPVAVRPSVTASVVYEPQLLQTSDRQRARNLSELFARAIMWAHQRLVFRIVLVSIQVFTGFIAQRADMGYA